MRTSLLALSFVLIADYPPKLAGDAAKLQGTWEFATLQIDGQDRPAKSVAGSKIEIAGDKFTTTTGQIVYKGTFKVDAAAKPKTIDMSFTDGPEKGKTNLGIYELDGDNWKICLSMKENVRPKDFTTKAGDAQALETLKRKKVESDVVKAELARFEGEWSMVSGENNGQPVPDAMREQFKRVCKGDETTVTVGDNMFLKAKFSVDPTKKPKAIDYTVIEGLTKGQKQLGIYEVEGDTLKFCLAKPGEERPKEFTAPVGSDRISSVWKKNKK